ncbi:peptidoglycan editing factor PgeF [Marinomonas transparens]|uniref:Purine nucleoside phosphorylase n=1 Tax=Marinomonas transparens TaxID=2795388 RepID=A0A934JR42_9GAMM|nr:peptidoglycan editing factor PgeF [Marinomonas transparens]MBJ7538278.1 peptidoglycan editing factor PgeF [Marinomonas transparens]
MSFSNTASVIQAAWPAPQNIHAYVSTRQGGVSGAPFKGLNMGAHVGDALAAVTENRHLFTESLALPNSLVWLNQVHGTEVACLPSACLPDAADAAFSAQKNQVCAVLTADCLPVFFCNKAGTQVAVAHAGWRGLCDGVLEATLEYFDNKADVLAWFGPAIGPTAFEVGDEVKEAFMAILPQAELAFFPKQEGKWLADLYLLARQRLEVAGVSQIYGGDYCTFTDEPHFYSYRRDGKTGRMASVIWIGD